MKLSDFFKSRTRKKVEALIKELTIEFVKVGIEKHNYKLTDIPGIPGYCNLMTKESDLRHDIKLLSSILR